MRNACVTLHESVVCVHACVSYKLIAPFMAMLMHIAYCLKVPVINKICTGHGNEFHSLTHSLARSLTHLFVTN